jgi:signal transduction histidine kinase
MKPFIILASLSSAVIATGVVLAVLAKKKERRMKEALKEQEHRLYEEKVALLINMSHELRTPLTLIMAPLKRMLVGMDPQDKNHETLSRMYRQARRMKDLLNIALDLRKMEVGKSVMKMEKHNFRPKLLFTKRISRKI